MLTTWFIRRSVSFLLVAFAFVSAPVSAAGDLPLQFVSPLPGSNRLLPETNIILRPGGIVDASWSSLPALVTVEGSSSGPHSGRLRLSSDGQTLTFQPDAPFAPSESVTVHVGEGLATDTRGAIPALEFQFTIAGPERATVGDVSSLASELAALQSTYGGGSTAALDAAAAATAADTLSAEIPPFSLTAPGPTGLGSLFLATIPFTSLPTPSCLLILDNDGTSRFHRLLNGGGLDFKLQPNGLLTYYDTVAGCFYALDTKYAVVDSFRTGNGYATDVHDFEILPNGHALLMSYDPQIVDMSQIIPKGRPRAIVLGLIIQELDEAKNVVFQWRSWDHFKITDAVGVVLGANVIDYAHGNSLQASPDGNIVISSRHMNEVTKISRATGEILWRLGGLNNQFTFRNDPAGFNYQHHARVLPNGNLTLFDNGNLHTPPVSRAVEYALDESTMTATLVWQYRHAPDVFSPAMGSVQRLPNGNTLIGWGYDGPAFTEVTADGRTVAEMSFTSRVVSYRAFRFEWPPVLPARTTIWPKKLPLQGILPFAVIVDPTDFAASDIDVSTIRLNDVVTIKPALAALLDVDLDGVKELTFLVDRKAMAPYLTLGVKTVKVTGTLKSGRTFRDFATVEIYKPAGGQTGLASAQVLSAPGELPIVMALDENDAGAAGTGLAARTVRVFDVRGRLVSRIEVPGSSRLVAWSGRGSDGRRVPTGVYFARFDGARPGEAKKIVIVR